LTCRTGYHRSLLKPWWNSCAPSAGKCFRHHTQWLSWWCNMPRWIHKQSLWTQYSFKLSQLCTRFHTEGPGQVNSSSRGRPAVMLPHHLENGNIKIWRLWLPFPFFICKSLWQRCSKLCQH
jgi:hypothetical protein